MAKLWSWSGGLAVGALGLVAACGSNNVASKVRPADPSSSAALGEGTCPIEPYTLDMDSDDVAKIERIARNGVIVIAQDCTKGEFKILPNCTGAGRYAYNGSTVDAETKSFTNTDDLKASFSSAAFVASASSDLKSGAALEIEYTTAGTSDAPAGLRKSDLKGQCDGATHVVQSILIGAYLTKTATMADVKAQGSGLGASANGQSTSQQKASKHRGDQQACATATQADTQMHPNCDVPIKLTLEKIGEASGPSAAAVAEGSAPPPQPGAKRPPPPPPPPISGLTYRTCKQGDVAGCTNACTRLHDGASCAILGFMYEKGKGVTADAAKAADAYAQGCDAGNLDGCAGLGTALSKGEGVPRDDAKAQQILGFGCGRNNARSCSSLGNRARIMGNKTDATFYLTRACRLGYGRACFYASSYLMQTQGPSSLTYELAMRGCEGHDLRGCLLAGSQLIQGKGMPANPTTGQRLGQLAFDGLDGACSDGDMEACEVMGDWYAGWYLNPQREVPKAVKYYSAACAGHQQDACKEAKNPSPPPTLPPPTTAAVLPPPPAPPPPPPANFNRYASTRR